MATRTLHRHPFRTYVSSICMLVLALRLPGFVQAQAQEPALRITITDLGTLGGAISLALDLNDQGQIVGRSTTAEGQELPVLWENGSQIILSTDEGGANGINSAGQIVGYSLPGGQLRAVLWHNSTMTDLGSVGSPIDDDFVAVASEINDQGWVVGQSNTPRGQFVPFLWQNGVMVELLGFGGPYNAAASVNNRGQIVGWATTPDEYFPEYRAVLWHDGIITDLSAGTESSFANDINDSGQAVGSSYNSVSGSRAVLWHGGEVTNLGTLGGNDSFATAINNQGQVVGASLTAHSEQYRAFLWYNGTMIDLGTLGGNGSIAYGINNQGNIVGYSETTSGQWHATLWTISEPPATPREQIQLIKAEVNVLNKQGVLNKGQANALTVKLDGALAKLERGDTKAAANQLQAFINQVSGLHKGKKLTTAQAQLLIDAANRVIEELRQ